ncbi:hypothetical protein LTR70_003936 [Exophiala xenobiotica]|uniref:Uncharacterized protein n=1 Tax=Lithohypha guttulata TaxID=1690604 RepID=A0ABR0K9N2_9EURO|nr:hypothetical protein LTR24_005300 [Lithohypha guttulata]KAK5322089.1 hypothetical protein LTR70_003936 [Exophiala xenobiotica]
MSSAPSTRRSSVTGVVLHEPSKSVPETPAKPRHEPEFRTVPESPKHNRLLSADHGLDIEILTHKLQLYQLELEEAELRLKHRRKMQDKQAADVAAAARFRNELDKSQRAEVQVETASKGSHARSTSLQTISTNAPPRASLPPRTTSMRVRSKRPQPLHLSSVPVMPQQVQSAALPIRRSKESDFGGDDMKRHWRRTTIAAGRNTSSRIILVSSPDMPPVPSLSASLSSVSPTTESPMTPQPTEDQIRRELETFALKEGAASVLSRRSSVISRRHMPAAFVPGDEDRLVPELAKSSRMVEAPTAWIDLGYDGESEPPSTPTLGRKKSFFKRFEKKNDVDALLDLYMTDEQLIEERQLKSKAMKLKRQTFFKRWQSSETSIHKFEKPK